VVLYLVLKLRISIFVVYRWMLFPMYNDIIYMYCCPDWSWGPPRLLYNGYRVFSRSKELPRCDADPSPLSSAMVKKEQSSTSTPCMGRMACAELQCLYKGALFLCMYCEHKGSIFIFLNRSLQEALLLELVDSNNFFLIPNVLYVALPQTIILQVIMESM